MMGDKKNVFRFYLTRRWMGIHFLKNKKYLTAVSSLYDLFIADFSLFCQFIFCYKLYMCIVKIIGIGTARVSLQLSLIL